MAPEGDKRHGGQGFQPTSGYPTGSPKEHGAISSRRRIETGLDVEEKEKVEEVARRREGRESARKQQLRLVRGEWGGGGGGGGGRHQKRHDGCTHGGKSARRPLSRGECQTFTFCPRFLAVLPYGVIIASNGGKWQIACFSVISIAQQTNIIVAK